MRNAAQRSSQKPANSNPNRSQTHRRGASGSQAVLLDPAGTYSGQDRFARPHAKVNGNRRGARQVHCGRPVAEVVPLHSGYTPFSRACTPHGRDDILPANTDLTSRLPRVRSKGAYLAAPFPRPSYNFALLPQICIPDRLQARVLPHRASQLASPCTPKVRFDADCQRRTEPLRRSGTLGSPRCRSPLRV